MSDDGVESVMRLTDKQLTLLAAMEPGKRHTAPELRKNDGIDLRPSGLSVILNRFRDHGYMTSDMSKKREPGSTRPRRWYKLTAKGNKARKKALERAAG